MRVLRCTLLTDGSSDRALIPHLRWLLKESGVIDPISLEWAELRHLQQVPRTLHERIAKSIDLYPADLLFIHKDAERDDPTSKAQEVADSLGRIDSAIHVPPIICLIPVRMQEAWLLFDEPAIRRAAGNPNGRVSIELPNLRTIEALPDAKNVLHEALKKASERNGRRLRQFNVSHAAMQVSQFIEDFSPLRRLPAFQRLESELKTRLAEKDKTEV